MKLLVIEDYTPLRTSLVQGLTEADFVVDSTGDGKEGLWYARDGAYDVIVLDLMLPGMDGLTILKKIRAARNKSPVLILTARDALDDRVKGLDMGADDYLVKPFAFAELLARVNALIRRKYDVGTNVLVIGDLSIDLKAKRVTFEDAQVELTAREYAIVEVLALRKGDVVSRTEISDQIYGFDAEPNSNAIDVHIAQLRRKLEPPGKPKLIHTRRGMGYILREITPCDH
ncbi:MAG: response regulator transcription factor [Phycisphaerales bacterium]